MKIKEFNKFELNPLNTISVKGGEGLTFYGEVCEDLSTYREEDDDKGNVTNHGSDQTKCEDNP